MGKHELVWLCLALVGLGIGGLTPPRLHAQVEPVSPTDTTLADTLPFTPQLLDGRWTCGALDQSFRVPFQLTSERVLTFSYDFDWPPRAPDTLYMYWEGVAWEAELALDEYYLGIQRQAFQPWEVWVARDWVKDSSRLWLTLQPGSGRAPVRWEQLGIFRPITLRSSALPSSLAALPEADPSQPVGLVAPYFREHGLVFDSLRAMQLLLPLRQEGIRQVAFWYGPSLRLRSLCESLGLKAVQLHPAVERVGLINWYPRPAAADQQRLPFWLDERGYRTPHYGRWVAWPTLRPGLPPEQDRLGLGWLLLLPLLGLFLIKLLGSPFFAALGQLLSSPSMFLESNFSSAALGGGVLAALTLVRLLVSSSLVALLMYALHWQQAWAWLETGNEMAWLHQVAGEYESLGGLWLLALGLVVGLEVIKLATWLLLGQAFGLRGFTGAMLSLDVVRHFPLLLLLPLAVALWLFWGDGQAWIPLGSLLLLLLIYGGRKIYVGYIGLDRGPSFSLGLKVLYICTLDLAPLLIWL